MLSSEGCKREFFAVKSIRMGLEVVGKGVEDATFACEEDLPAAPGVIPIKYKKVPRNANKDELF